MAISAGLAGALGGGFRAAGQASTRWLDLSMRRQEQERQLAQKQRELEARKADMERQRDMQEMSQRLAFINVALKSRDRGIIKSAFDDWNVSAGADDPQLDYSKYVTDEAKQKEILGAIKNVGGVWEASDKTPADLNNFRQALIALTADLDPVYDEQALSNIEYELGRVGDIQSSLTRTQERRQTLADTGEVIPGSQLTPEQRGEVEPRFTQEGVEYFGPEEEAPTPPSLIQQYNLAQEQGETRNFTEWKKDIARASATNIQIGREERAGKVHEIKVGATVAQIENDLTGIEKDNKAFFDANASRFNELSKNRVAYWETEQERWHGMWTGEQTKITTLSREAIKAGWTPERVQKEVDQGATAKGILVQFGLIKTEGGPGRVIAPTDRWPSHIKKTAQAIRYLMDEYDMTEAEARNWLNRIR